MASRPPPTISPAAADRLNAVPYMGRRPSCATWAAATWTPDQKLEHHNGVRCVTYR
eukprot:COSAG05_NODE_15598_length_365_cov_2.503759_1_plen_55_part_01